MAARPVNAAIGTTLRFLDWLFSLVFFPLRLLAPPAPESSPADDAREFAASFRNKFGQGAAPHFVEDSISAASQRARDEDRLLLAYLHADENEDAEEFCRCVPRTHPSDWLGATGCARPLPRWRPRSRHTSAVLCSSGFKSFVGENALLWAGSVDRTAFPCPVPCLRPRSGPPSVPHRVQGRRHRALQTSCKPPASPSSPSSRRGPRERSWRWWIALRVRCSPHACGGTPHHHPRPPHRLHPVRGARRAGQRSDGGRAGGAGEAESGAGGAPGGAAASRRAEQGAGGSDGEGQGEARSRPQGGGGGATGGGGAATTRGGGLRRPGASHLRNALTRPSWLQREQQELAEAKAAREAASARVPDEPPRGAEGAVAIRFNLPDGSREQRRFLRKNTLGEVHAFVASALHERDSAIVRFELSSNFPRRRYTQVRCGSLLRGRLCRARGHNSPASPVGAVARWCSSCMRPLVFRCQEEHERTLEELDFKGGVLFVQDLDA